MTKELVQRLRDEVVWEAPAEELMREAASAIEQLDSDAACATAERDSYKAHLVTVHERLKLAIEHGDVHGWATAKNELRGILDSCYWPAREPEAAPCPVCEGTGKLKVMTSMSDGTWLMPGSGCPYCTTQRTRE